MNKNIISKIIPYILSHNDDFFEIMKYLNSSKLTNTEQNIQPRNLLAELKSVSFQLVYHRRREPVVSVQWGGNSLCLFVLVTDQIWLHVV